MNWLAPTGIWSTGKVEIVFVHNFQYKNEQKRKPDPMRSACCSRDLCQRGLRLWNCQKAKKPVHEPEESETHTRALYSAGGWADSLR